ncbi:Zinc finger protein [Pseudolycoriella hygida]|uniref:Zinc finger protein n=1 Tax=Pseudolycoriella hygida TaxID=35572 RepID=A0A9Q0RUE6_9DIPT|nr:Zinc finger protein [Pseudolycoriella hygida]
MNCLLCCESSKDTINVTSNEGNHHLISSLLFKYFRFCFDKEPTNGELCTECWQKLILFHEFYVRIEYIYEEKNKSQIVSSIFNVKEENADKFGSVEINDSSLKWEPIFDDEGTEDVSQVFVSETKWDDSDDQSNIDIKPKLSKQRKSRKKCEVAKKKRRTPHAKRPPTFTCTIRQCAEEFPTKDDLISHKMTTHKRVQCTLCPDPKLVLDLNTHLKNMHGIIQNTICEHCGQVFHSNATFLSHVKGVHETHEPLQCDICKDWFKSRDSIRSHMTYVHIQGPQTCQICGKVSTNRKSLLKHQLIHVEARKDRYKCIVCGKGFRDNTKLKEHSYIHSGVTDAYSCNFCGKNFRFGSSLSAHRMKMHPIEMAHVKYRLQWKKNVELKI